MNRIFFFLCSTFFFVTSAFPQTNVYHPFPDSDAVWNEDYWQEGECGIYPPCDRINDFSYIISGDTVINSKSYHKLYMPFVIRSSYGWTPCGCSDYLRGIGYNGGIRQDTSNKKVWFIDHGAALEYLLYDFN